MKKIALTFAAAAIALASAPGAVKAADATANSSVTVIQAITITKDADMAFGTVSVASGNAAGTVDIANTADSASTSSAGLTIVGGGASRAKFTIAGQGSQSYSLTIPTTASLTDQGGNGGAAMTVNLAPDVAAGTQSLPGGGSQALNIGGTLNVGASQAASSYTGSFQVTVAYN